MKNKRKTMNKLMAMILSLILMTSLSTASFAQVSSESATCEAIGMIVGTGNGVTLEYLESISLRYQAAVLFLRLRGLEEEMNNFEYEGKETFADAGGESEYTKRLLAYLKAHPELGWQGYADGSFKPNQVITAKEYTKVMLEALGYEYGVDYTWDEVNEFAETIGFSNKAIDIFTIDDLCVVTVEALKAQNSEGQILVNKLIEMGVIKTTDAVLVGLVEVPDALNVDSVKLDSLGEMTVTFNQELNENDIKLRHFTVSINQKEVEPVRYSVKGAEVRLFFDYQDIEQQDYVDVVISHEIGMESDVKKTVSSAFDITIPEVAALEVYGPSEFLVTFSEPILEKPKVEINDGEYAVYVDGFHIGDKQVIVKAHGTLNLGRIYTVKITDATDYTGYTMLGYEKNIEYDKKTTAPTAEITYVSETEVTVVFSDRVSNVSNESFWHTFESYQADEVTPDTTDGEYTDEYHIKFNSAYIGYSDTTFGIVGGSIVDVWGNIIFDDIEITVKSEEDTIPPVVTLLEAYDDYLIVEFSEDIRNFEEKHIELISVDDNDEIDISSISTKDLEDYQYKVKYDDLTSENYKLTISDVSDTSFKLNKLEETTFTFKVNDKSGPDLDKIKAQVLDDGFYVDFDDPMDESTATTAMWLGYDGTNYYTPKSVEFLNSANEEVIIEFDEDDDIDTFTKIVVGKVMDDSGNKAEQLSTELDIVSLMPKEIIEVHTVDYNYITVKVEGRIVDGIKAENVEIVDGDGNKDTAARVSKEYVDNNTNTLITVKLPSDLYLSGGEVPDSVKLKNMEADTGATVGEGKFIDSSKIYDGIGPSLVDSSYADGIVNLEYDESLMSSLQSSMVSSIIITEKDSGDELSAGIDYTTTVVSGDTIRITFEIDTDGKSYLLRTEGNPIYIRDNEGNISNKISEEIEINF